MHSLEFMLFALAKRIESEGDKGLAAELESLASISHDYVPEPGVEERLAERCNDYHRRYDHLIHPPLSKK